MEVGWNVDELADDEREGELDGDAAGDSDESAEDAEEEGLQDVDFDDLRAARAEGLHDGDGVQALLEVGAHGHGDADRAEHEGDEAHEGEQAGGAVEAVGDSGTALAVVSDLGFGQGCYELRFEAGDSAVGDRLAGGGRRKLEEDALGGAVAGSKQTGGLERGTGDKDARADGEAAREAVGLVDDGGDDAEGLVAELERVADVRVEAE